MQVNSTVGAIKERKMKRCCLVLAILLSSSWVHADEISDMKKEIDLLKCEVAKLRNIVQGETAKNATPAIDRKAGIRRK